MRLIEFHLKPIAPFSLEFTAWALKRIPLDPMHHWDGETLTRATMFKRRSVLLRVSQSGNTRLPLLQLQVRGAVDQGDEPELQQLVSRMLGLSIDLEPFYRRASNSGKLALLARQFRGLKPPRFPTIFEAFVNAVANQQLSLQVGIKLLGKLSQAYGKRVTSGITGWEAYTFPTPEAIARATEADLLAMGFSRNKAQYLITVAQAVADGQLDFESLGTMDSSALVETLKQIRGIGRWSAQYMLLRGYGRLDSFPIDDAGARSRLIDYLGLDKGTNVSQLESYVRSWDPYAGMLYFHLLLYNLRKKGAFS